MMNDSRDELTDALRRLKDHDASLTTSPVVLSRVAAEFRLIALERSRRTRTLILQIAAAALIALAPVTWWALTHRDRARETAATTAPQEVVTQYFPLFYSSVPASSVHVVRMEVPRASMARFGLLPGDALRRATGTVLADVIVGDDGLARAVRFVQKVSQEP